MPHWIDALHDPRDPDQLYYTRRHLLWHGVLMFLQRLGSRHQFGLGRHAPALLHNLRQLAKTDEESVAHPDTVAYLMERLATEEMAGLLSEFTRRLIRMKALDDWRVRGHFLVAVDGTGYLSFDQPHCEHCIQVTHASGQVSYRHSVVVAFLVNNQGVAIPLAVEFVENPPQPFDKQDCELKAFARLAPRLKSLFPQTPFCLLMDALYASVSVMATCRQYGWKYGISFKESDMPALWQEAVSLRDLSQDQGRTLRYCFPNLKTKTETVCTVRLRWVNDLEHQGESLSALFQDETIAAETKHFAYLTNWSLDADTVEQTATAARQRWRIENEGFNVLKNGGYDLEHAYSRNFTAAKNYFHLMLIAYLIHQLMVRGSLFTCFRKQLVTGKNLVMELIVALRTQLIPTDAIPPPQIRLDPA